MSTADLWQTLTTADGLAALVEVMIIDLSALFDGPREEAMARCVELGHALGNQHWPAVIKGSRVYVPLTVARAVMSSVMKTHSFEGVTYTFVPGAEVIPYLAPHEARRLFGATGGHRHSPVPELPDCRADRAREPARSISSE